MTTTEHPESDEVMAWLDGELTAEADANVRAHVDGCPACRAVADELRSTSRQLAAWRVEAAPKSLTSPSPASRAIAWPRRLLWPAAILVAALLLTARVKCESGECGPTHGLTFRTPWSAPALPPVPASSTLQSGDPRNQAAFERFWNQLPRIDIDEPAAGSKVVIVMFTDWQCPGCKAGHEMYSRVVANYARTMPGAVKFVTRDFPLNPACNPNVKAPIHSAPCEAAVAVRLAKEHGRGDEMIAWLFANQDGLTRDRVKQAAETIGGVTDFDARYSAMNDALVRETKDDARFAIGVTPTIFINGVRAASETGGLLSPEQFDWAIQCELKRAGTLVIK